MDESNSLASISTGNSNLEAKEVKSSRPTSKKLKMPQVKENFLLDIVFCIQNGLNASQIATHFNISKQMLNPYISSLKAQGIIAKRGYGVWEVISKEVKSSSHKGASQDATSKNVRGHAFIWKVKLNRQFNYKELLKARNINFEEKGIAQTPRIILNKKKVWLGKSFITIFEPKGNNFFAINSIESKKKALIDLEHTLESLKMTLGVDFKYKFTVRRQHYGLIHNLEAKTFLANGQKLLIKDETGYWFSIDNSDNKWEEAEAISESRADIDALNYQNYMNSQRRTGFKATPEFILASLNQVTNNQLIFAQNIESHIQAIKDISTGVRKLNSTIDKLKEHLK